MTQALLFDSYRPVFPEDPGQWGIAVIGCGSVVNKWHLPQYKAHGLRVAGCWDNDSSAIAKTVASFHDMTAYDSLEEMLSDRLVDIVDIATTVSGRAELIQKALAAGKHVLAQKPLCCDAVELARIGNAVALNSSVRFAVNLNGRWAPPWRAATKLIEAGAIGDVLAISHFHDFRMSWLPNVERHGSTMFLLFDYMVHWVDISLVWSKAHGQVRVWSDVVTQPSPHDDLLTTQVGWLNFTTSQNVSVTIRSVPAARAYTGHAFVIHGTSGTLRGSVDAPIGGEYLEIERNEILERPPLVGSWFPDGFAGTMGELLCSIAENRQPETNFVAASATQQVIFAACQSAQDRGQPVDVCLA